MPYVDPRRRTAAPAPARNSGMRAVILVGGFGTRLRPLTLTSPKPLVPFCNKPMIIHQVEALKAAGVTEVVLAIAYRPDAMRAEMDQWAKELGVSFVYSVEEEPLGTAGPLSLARDTLLQDNQPFFVLNSDVTCRFPLKELLDFHKKHGREGTIMTTQVKDWEKYGVVVYDEKTKKIQKFVEKPQTFVGDRINAGIYIFNKSILKRIPMRKTSIEKEIFPAMAAANELYAFTDEGFWKDIGQPRDFIDGLGLFIPNLVGKDPEVFTERDPRCAGKFTVVGCAKIDHTAKIAPGCVIGPNVSIGANCTIGESCRIENSAVFNNTTVGQGTFISGSIIGWNNQIGGWCHITNTSVFGDDVEVKCGIVVNGVRCLPNKGISEDCLEPKIIM